MSDQEFREQFSKVYNAALMRNRDRGNIKWTAMMLPEHVKMLRQDSDEYHKVVRPQLDEFDLETMQEEVQRALASKLETRITSWKDGQIHYHRGIVREVSTRYLVYEDPFGKHELPIDEIVAVMITE